MRSSILTVAAVLVACSSHPNSRDAVLGTGGGSSSEASAAESTAASDRGGSEADGETGSAWEPGPGPWDAGFAIPFVAQPPGDPAAGRWALLNRDYLGCGIPWSLFGAAKPLLGDFAAGPSMPGREGKNAEVPYNWTVFTAPSGAELVGLNCLQCHAGRINGELVVGLAPSDADFTTPLGGILAGLPLPQVPVPGLAEFGRFASRYQAISPHIEMATVGSNPGDMVTLALAAHRDPQTMQWSDTPYEVLPEVTIPMDPPPWWRVKKKNAMFYNAMGRGDHRGTLTLASLLCIEDAADLEPIYDMFRDVRAYLASLEAPEYPFGIDEALADTGEALFMRHCAGCHGTYGVTDADDTYPNLLLPLEVIGTDPLSARYPVDEPFFAQWFDRSRHAQDTDLVPDEPFAGYVAPPLDGIWATAPFFHNGSVPNLELVLNSRARPEAWRRVDYDSTHFDGIGVGWPYREVELASTPEAERKHVFDTRRVGHSNAGHSFGDALTAQERAAVIEYLKTL